MRPVSFDFYSHALPGDLNEDRNGNMNGEDPNAWPEADDSQIYKFFDDGSWTTRVTANTAVSATYKRDIPGYKVSSVIIKNNKTRRLMTPQAMGRWGRPRPLMSLPGLSAEICPMMT